LGCGSAGHAAGQARESTIPKSILAILIVLGANICRVYCRDWNRLCLDWVSKQRTGKASKWSSHGLWRSSAQGQGHTLADT
jgi:hypothetical protein